MRVRKTRTIAQLATGVIVRSPTSITLPMRQRVGRYHPDHAGASSDPRSIESIRRALILLPTNGEEAAS
jgi:hypothetical protein